ncbi:MAG TPA: hypothetical protein VNV42_12550 [Solirubrobacteraceae bacterium]|nr:hypothetical protein [Solirubrobacteraceae bacterium]
MCALLASLAVAAALAGAWWMCAPADAVILPPQTIDGPSAAIGEFGGAAVSADGSGGLVYTKQAEGATHVFAAQFFDNRWLPPVRVDWQSPYSAIDPRIGAADGGELIAVWVTQIATVERRVQDALMASTLAVGASAFGPPYVVDPDVGEGAGVSPSLAVSSNGLALVAYRAVTHNFTTSPVVVAIPRLRPGDVLADIRVARYHGARWSVLAPINRDLQLSMRPPSETNGPQVGIGRSGEAVVAWQEPEANGIARVWARRIFGGTLGLVLPASPVTYNGAAITEDATAFGLSVSPFGEAEVVSTVAGGLPAAPLLFANTLPGSTAPSGAQFLGAVRVGPAAGEVGAPSVAVDDLGEYRIAYAAAGTARIVAGAEKGGAKPEVPLGPDAAASGAGAVTALNPNGGGTSAWPASGSGVGLREDFPDGAAQAAQVSGAQGGSVSELAIGGSETGEALLGFREGQPGAYEIVGERVSVSPPQFDLKLPKTWVRPSAALIEWTNAEDATGGVTYSLAIDGQVVRRGIAGSSVLPDRRLLGSGVHEVQVIATDASGQQTLSNEAELKIAATPPVAHLSHARGRAVIVRVVDHQAGAVARDTKIAFGDGTWVNGRLTARHTYLRPGRYTIVVHMRDTVGNEGTAHLRVSVR